MNESTEKEKFVWVFKKAFGPLRRPVVLFLLVPLDKIYLSSIYGGSEFPHVKPDSRGGQERSDSRGGHEQSDSASTEPDCINPKFIESGVIPDHTKLCTSELHVLGVQILDSLPFSPSPDYPYQSTRSSDFLYRLGEKKTSSIEEGYNDCRKGLHFFTHFDNAKMFGLHWSMRTPIHLFSTPFRLNEGMRDFTLKLISEGRLLFLDRHLSSFIVNLKHVYAEQKEHDSRGGQEQGDSATRHEQSDSPKAQERSDSTTRHEQSDSPKAQARSDSVNEVSKI